MLLAMIDGSSYQTNISSTLLVLEGPIHSVGYDVYLQADVGVNDEPSVGLAFCPAGYGLQKAY